MKYTFVGLLAVMMLMVTACNRPTDAAAKPIIPDVKVIRPQRGDAIRSITLPGDVVGYYESALHSKVTGYLTHIYVDKGDWVKKGQVLADIEVPELTDNLNRARANLTIAELTYQRLKSVRDSDPRLVAEQTVDIAFSKYQAAKAQFGLLETMLSYTKIIAPFDGVITGRFADPGALIRAGGSDIGVNGAGAMLSSGATEGAGPHLSGPVLTLAKIDKLRVYVYVPERDVGFIRIGTPAQITVRAYPNRVITATVSRFATSLDLTSRTMLTELDIANPEHRLYPRMYADVTLDLEVHHNALELPLSAVGGLSGPENDRNRMGFVYEVQDGRLIKTPVTTGITNGRLVEIVSGLNESSLVTSSISSTLIQGQRIRPILVKNDKFNGKHFASLE